MKINLCLLNGLTERNILREIKIVETLKNQEKKRKLLILLKRNLRHVRMNIAITTRMEKRLVEYHDSIIRLGFERSKK